MLQDSQTFKIHDAASYDSVTGEFDRFSDRLSQPLAERMVALAQLKPNEKVLDIDTGTGIVALQVARTLGSRSKIMGIDLSDAMLGAATAKIEYSKSSGTVEFRRMDAEALEIEDASFDVLMQSRGCISRAAAGCFIHMPRFM